jgi:hypothetical protein
MSEAETISRNGDQYEFYAGPFHSLATAFDFIDARIAYGAVAEDELMVDHKTGKVYRLVPAPPLSPE